MESTDTNIKTVDNHIYMYCDITPKSALELIEELQKLNRKLLVDNVVNFGTMPIVLHINSDGGDMASSFAIADMIKNLETAVYSIIEGVAASGATIISSGCDKRYITENSLMLLHPMFSVYCGNYEELKDQSFGNDLAMKQYVRFYVKHSKLTKKEVKRLLKRQSWLSPEMALEYGLVDEVI
ncbi:MAG: Clp protease ClpP [Candidatus Paceibacterota bacterium]